MLNMRTWGMNYFYLLLILSLHVVKFYQKKSVKYTIHDICNKILQMPTPTSAKYLVYFLTRRKKSRMNENCHHCSQARMMMVVGVRDVILDPVIIWPDTTQI